jgi:hypothetical protein
MFWPHRNKLLSWLSKGYVASAEWLNVNWVEIIIHPFIYAHIHTFIKFIHNSSLFYGGS